MRASRIAQVVATLSVGLWQTIGHSQAYEYSGPVNGYSGPGSPPTSGFAEVDLTPGGLGAGGFDVTFGTVNETLFYNPVADTLRTVGSVTITSPSTESFNIRPDGILYPATDHGSAFLTVGHNDSFSFDSTISLNAFGASAFDLAIPVSASGIYNGQAFSGSYDIDLPLFVRIYSSSDTALSFSQFTLGSSGAQPSSQVFGNGLKDGTSDDTYYYAWNVGPAMATAQVSELSNGAPLLGLGLTSLVIFRRWSRFVS